MAGTLSIKPINGGSGSEYTVQNGQTLRIAAQDNVHYQLANDSGLAPNVQTARQGNDLLVNLGGDGNIVLENYFLYDDTTPYSACKATGN